MTIPVADLHCDLLTFLARDKARSVFDPESRCSISQLKEGNVFLQTMAIFTEGKENSYLEGKQQARIFSELIKEHPEIQMIAAIENASSLLSEKESINLLEKRLKDFLETLGKILYISFTWNGENRFGGGARVQEVGLKEDGKKLLRLLHQKKIAVDLSHASDQLAFDVLGMIDKENLDVPVIASHSNCRKVLVHDRNLPDELIQEIVRRDGLIGLNFVRHFIDAFSFTKICAHVEHLLKLGAEPVLSLGSDFFAAADLPLERFSLHKSWFFEGFDNASTHQKALHIIGQSTGRELLEKVAYQNVMSFLERNGNANA